MRPKKIILLVEADEHTLSVNSFLFETWGYAVRTSMDATPDPLIAPADQLAEVQAFHPGLVCTSLIADERGTLLRARIAALMVRKRGPKKVYPPVSEVAMDSYWRGLMADDKYELLESARAEIRRGGA